MLCDLFGEEAGKVYRSWNTAVKLDWGLPRTTHKYLVDHLLGLGMPSVRQRLLCQYVGYVRKMFKSSSKEVRVLSQILARNAQSVTGRTFSTSRMSFSLILRSIPLDSSSPTERCLNQDPTKNKASGFGSCVEKFSDSW